MGVHGLWKLIEPSGRPVPLETLENKVLAVDVSIWLHQVVKGFQDAKGASVPNAHLLGVYHRICKLLYFRIKPVFVFDGGVPVLKKETIAKRGQFKAKKLSEADRIHRDLLNTLLKHSAISKVLSEKTKAAITPATKDISRTDKQDDLYFLPPCELDCTISSSSDEEPSTEDSSPSAKQWDLHSIDTQSAQFKSLPLEVRHEILTDLKETRKQSSWGRINELPTVSDDFSGYQMNRLLKRQSVQSALEEAEKEMGGHSMSLGELEQILKDQGVLTTNNPVGNRIASDENTRFLLIKDLKQAIEVEKSKQKDLEAIVEKSDESDKDVEAESTTDSKKDEIQGNKGDAEFEDDLKRAIALSLQDEPSTSKQISNEAAPGKSKLEFSFLEGFSQTDFASESSEEETVKEVVTKLKSAQSYMMEYSGLTPSEIAKIIAGKAKPPAKEKEVAHKEVQKNASTETKLLNSESKPESLIAVADSTVPFEVEAHVSREPEALELNRKEKVTSTEEDTAKETVELMSESSSSADDFVEVDEDTVKSSTEEAMEVVIKPDDTLEDDLFGDVFSTAETSNEVAQPEKERQIEKVMENGHENKVASKGQTLKEKLERYISMKSPTKTKRASSSNNNEKMTLSVTELTEIEGNLRREQADMFREQSLKDRLATNITDQMYQETQDLLELFGVPYIIAPMEAEAQCAFLEQINLTDGTITDDSDIWLFGGRTVYKNFFNNQKQVMEFRADNIKHNFKLTREQMILLALLVGSDYTIGLHGVGPVTALEILAAFPPKSLEFTLSHSELLSGLQDFRSWFNKGKQPAPGRNGLRTKLKNVILMDSFPSTQVVQAYLDPTVETSNEQFTWAAPNILGLNEFARIKFGWTKIKTEEVLKPVLRRMKDHKLQTTIRDYFKTQLKVDSGQAEAKMSKRVKTALDKIEKGHSEEVADEPKPKKTRRKKQLDAAEKVDQPKEDKAGSKPKRRQLAKKINTVDEDIEILRQVEATSAKKVEEINHQMQTKLQEIAKPVVMNLHKKEIIPQKQREQNYLLRNKLKAIEVFRKSKLGPGFIKKKAKTKQAPKEDAGLSESSSDD